jgi:hypothetical protein
VRACYTGKGMVLQTQVTHLPIPFLRLLNAVRTLACPVAPSYTSGRRRSGQITRCMRQCQRRPNTGLQNHRSQCSTSQWHPAMRRTLRRPVTTYPLLSPLVPPVTTYPPTQAFLYNATDSTLRTGDAQWCVSYLGYAEANTHITACESPPWSVPGIGSQQWTQTLADGTLHVVANTEKVDTSVYSRVQLLLRSLQDDCYRVRLYLALQVLDVYDCSFSAGTVQVGAHYLAPSFAIFCYVCVCVCVYCLFHPPDLYSRCT